MAKTNSRPLDDANSELQTSNSLIDGVKNDDPVAWNRLVNLYSPLVYYWCQKSGLPATDLNDIFQEVFHALAGNIQKYQSTKNGSFRGWLRTLTRNKVNDHFRKAKRQTQPAGGTEALRYLEQFPATEDRIEGADVSNSDFDDLSPEESTNPAADSNRHQPETGETELEQALLRQALANIRDHFTDNTWQAFWMVVIDGRKTTDVAADLSMRPGTVRVAKSRVLKRLRRELGDSID